MTELKMEHVLMFVILGFALYHFVGGCKCNGFSVGGQDICKGGTYYNCVDSCPEVARYPNQPSPRDECINNCQENCPPPPPDPDPFAPPTPGEKQRENCMNKCRGYNKCDIRGISSEAHNKCMEYCDTRVDAGYCS